MHTDWVLADWHLLVAVVVGSTPQRPSRQLLASTGCLHGSLAALVE